MEHRIVSPSEEAFLHKRVMIRILDLYNFGDESTITNPMFKAIFSSVPVVMLWIDYMQRIKEIGKTKMLILAIPIASSLTTDHFSLSFVRTALIASVTTRNACSLRIHHLQG